MATITAKAFHVTESSRELLQTFIVEQIPEDTQYLLASPEGYMFFNEKPAFLVDGKIRVPQMMFVSYIDIEYESE